MNARKRKIIGKTDNAKRYHVDPEEMDRYLFASEFAARIIQDREYVENQRAITVDHILCEPTLAKEFDEIARTICPGFTALDYRWALFALRKAKSRRRKGTIAELPFVWLGPLDAMRIANVNRVEGFLWLRTAQSHIYVGHSQDVRQLLERIAQARVERILNELPLFQSQKCERLEVGISEQPRSSATSREPFKNIIVAQCSPYLNIRQWQTSRNPQKGEKSAETQRARSAA